MFKIHISLFLKVVWEEEEGDITPEIFGYFIKIQIRLLQLVITLSIMCTYQGCVYI